MDITGNNTYGGLEMYTKCTWHNISPIFIVKFWVIYQLSDRKYIRVPISLINADKKLYYMDLGLRRRGYSMGKIRRQLFVCEGYCF